MNSVDEEIVSKVECQLKNKGKKNIRIAIALFVVALIIQIILLQVTNLNLYDDWKLFAKLMFPGLFFLGIGLRQFYFKHGMDIRETKVQMYGLEEPEKFWHCPKCKKENPNLTFDCHSCGYSLK